MTKMNFDTNLLYNYSRKLNTELKIKILNYLNLIFININI